MSKPRAKSTPAATAVTVEERKFSVRFLIAILMILGGIAWLAWYYTAVRVGTAGAGGGSPKAIADLGKWNYLIGFAVLLLGLAVSAHPSTPLGRGRGVVIGMLGCFLIGLLWICFYYVISNDPAPWPIFNDLLNYNLLVGIGFMAVGFSFATRWE